jgi:hypothetical protein
MKGWFLVFLSLFYCNGNLILANNSGKISGKVKDLKTGESLLGVVILIEGTHLGATSDANGDYFIINVPPGTYTVTGSLVGYGKIKQTEVKVRIDLTTYLNFNLQETSVQMQDVTVIAEKPKVELDNTASKESLSKEDIANTWGGDLKDVISDIAGTNEHGGIRGGFGNDVSFRMDGLDLRDVGSNTNFGSVNLSTIQEVQVLTGGWNAEFGQANGAIINVVTRKTQDKFHVIFQDKRRPAGQYHWGRNFFGGQDDPFSTVMTSPNFWNPDSTWKTPWMTAPKKGYDGGSNYFKAMTPQQRADWWKNFTNDKSQFEQIDYTKRQEWEDELTMYGKIDQIGYMISGRYKEGVTVYPSVLKYNPDWTLQGTVDWDITPASKLAVTGIFTKFINSGDPRTFYQSSESTSGDVTGQQLPFISDPYSVYRYWMFGTKGGSDQFTIRPPEKAQFLNMQAKFTHVFNSSTFLEAAFQHSDMRYDLDFSDIARSAAFPGYGYPPLPTSKDTLLGGIPAFGETPPKSFWDPTYWGVFGDVWSSHSYTQSFGLKTDFTTQYNKYNLFKTGIMFSYQRMDKSTHEGSSGLPPSTSAFAQVDDIIPIINKPYEGAAYLQDKIEIGGMVINAGLRFDFFNANKVVSSNIFDPLMMSDSTVGHTGPIGHISYRPDGTGPGYVKTPLRWAFSPRLGISHPITETTVLHFMYGKFNQRPAWNKILSNPVVWTNKLPSNINSGLKLPDTTLVTYRYYGQKVGNPGLTWEKMTQYEVGFEQNLFNLFSLDVTMYYKDAYDLTSLGINQGPGSSSIQQSGGNVDVRLYGDPYSPDGQVVGTNIRNFTTTVNGAWADVRGIEIKLDSRFNWINFNFIYNLSYLTNGSYHYSKMYQEFPSGVQLADNVYSGASNTDNGGIGTNDQRWNPNNSAVLKINVVSPSDFGPEVWGIYILGDWSISTSTRWSQGESFTWYPSDYVGEQIPLNQRWPDSWMTNMNISKTFRLSDNTKMKFFIQVSNVFNNKNLRFLTSATDRNLYMTQGILPFQSTTLEPTEWSWYSDLPRQIYFGTNIEL